MDIFKFNNPTTFTDTGGGIVIDDTVMQKGEIINNLNTIMWIERYRDAGEFTLTASADSGVKEKLPIGSFISHIDSYEIMIVEDHHLVVDKDNEPQLAVTGRSFETFLENRTILMGGYGSWEDYSERHSYVFTANYTWEQAKVLILEAVRYEWMIDDNYALAGMQPYSLVYGSGTSIERTLDDGSTYARVMELLAIDDIGIKTIRPGPWTPVSPTTDTAILIHNGLDKTSEVIFSYDLGEIESAEYLWSNRTFKNAALVLSKWFKVAVDPVETGYNRRAAIVDGKDIDNDFNDLPVGTDQTDIVAAMTQRGIDFLASQKEVVLTKAEISRENSEHRYRSDYNIGDLVTVRGDYNTTSVMRVTEYVETEDETGESGYPTLTMI